MFAKDVIKKQNLQSLKFWVRACSVILNIDAELEETWSIKPALLLIPVPSSGVPKATLRLHKSPEGLTELIESCSTHGYSLLQLKDSD